MDEVQCYDYDNHFVLGMLIHEENTCIYVLLYLPDAGSVFMYYQIIIVFKTKGVPVLNEQKKQIFKYFLLYVKSTTLSKACFYNINKKLSLE